MHPIVNEAHSTTAKAKQLHPIRDESVYFNVTKRKSMLKTPSVRFNVTASDSSSLNEKSNESIESGNKSSEKYFSPNVSNESKTDSCIEISDTSTESVMNTSSGKSSPVRRRSYRGISSQFKSIDNLMDEDKISCKEIQKVSPLINKPTNRILFPKNAEESADDDSSVSTECNIYFFEKLL